jgi:2-polyprenyl-3-methyl-5-hydroxy-6-metoxy-1,4-benzoquinol methylase
MTEPIDWNDYLSSRRTGSYTDRELIKPFLQGDILDVGCGYGTFIIGCARELGSNVAGVDPSNMAIASAKKEWPSGRFEIGTAEALPFPDACFDTVVSIEVVEHLKQPDLFFKEAARVLRPDGHLIVQTPNYPIKRFYDFAHLLLKRRASLKDDPTHVSPFNFKRMKNSATAADFRVLSLSGRNILGENRLPLLKRLKLSKLAPLIVQKMILIAQKISAD